LTRWIIFLLQTPSVTPSPPLVDPSAIPLKDEYALIISAASFCFAIAAFFRASFEQRRRIILDQILAEISALEELSVDIVKQVESILLTCRHSELSPDDSYVATQHEFRKAEVRLTNLEMILPREQDNIHRQYVDWHSALTHDRFPVLKIDHCYRISDERFVRVALAEAGWRRYLFNLRLRCLRNQIKFWKKK
jgi:hypothetical protein